MADSENGTGGHPKRRAAQKATALAAGQLESSSEEEEEEPPRGKKVARGKGKASRGRVSVATGREQAVGKGRRAIQQQASLPDLSIPSKPRSRTNSLSKQVPSTTITPRKKPAARASGSKLKVHAEAIVIHDSDSEADEGPSQLSSPKAGPSSQSLGKAGASSWKKSPLKSSGGGKKRQRVFSPATSENPSALTAAGDDGELTDVSMASATENDGFPQKPRSGHPPPLSSVRTESLRSILTDPESGPEYNFAAHGPHVWVKIDEEGQLTTVNPASKDVRTMWWPAKVKQHNPLHVSLFGEPPGPVTFTHTSMLSKSSVAILSLKTQDNVVRFNNGNFASWSITRPTEPLQSTSTPFSPRKRQKTVQSSLEDKFEEARLEMLKADQKDNDGFPSTLSQLLKTGEVELRSSPSPPPFNLYDEEEEAEDIWVPPSTYCGIYEIPGELVLSKAYRSREDRWPAKILEWIPPRKRGATEKFKVVFYDGTNKVVPASWLVSTADEEFETCKMGDTVGNYGLNDEEQDDFDDDISPSRFRNSPVSPLSTFNSFITFPADFIPELPIPPAPSTTSDLSSRTSEHPSSSTSSPEAFDDLPLHLQLSHTIPVMYAILTQSYPVAFLQDRHTRFMKGGGSRRGVCDDMTSYERRGVLSREILEGAEKWVREEVKRVVREISKRYGDTLRSEEGEAAVSEIKAHGDEKEINSEGDVSGGNDANSTVDTGMKGGAESQQAAEHDLHSMQDPTSPPHNIKVSDAVTVGQNEAQTPAWRSSNVAESVNEIVDITDTVDTHISLTETFQTPAKATPSPPPATQQVPQYDGDSKVLHDTTNDIVPSRGSPDATDPLVEEDSDIHKVTDHEGGTQTSNIKTPWKSRSFFSLSEIDQITYCTNILTPEIILQLLLWHENLRTSYELLSNTEEEELYKLGVEKAEDGDRYQWVKEIVYSWRSARGAMLSFGGSNQKGKNGWTLNNTEEAEDAGRLRSGRGFR